MSSNSSETKSTSSICQLCSKSYTDPCQLPCLHMFCKACLQKEIKKQEAKESLQCPDASCKKKVDIPKGGIEAFQQDLHDTSSKSNISPQPTSAICQLCSAIYADPRLLPCLHTFCKGCLQKELERQGTKESLQCPEAKCKKNIAIPKGGIEAIQKDLRANYKADVAHAKEKIKGDTDASCDRCTAEDPAVSYCCDCSDFLCEACKNDHTKWRKTKMHDVVDIGKSKSDDTIVRSISRKPMYCQLHVHEDMILKYYCLTCGTLICRDCADYEETHANHKNKINLVDKVAEQEKTNLRSDLVNAKSVKSELENAMSKVEKVVQCVKTKEGIVKEEIRETFETIYEALKSREEALVAKCSEIALQKRTALGIQYDELKTVHVAISHASEMIAEATDQYASAEMLSVKGVMTSTLQDLMEQFKKCTLEPCKSDMMPTSLDNAELVKEISSFGVVTGGCYPATSTANLYIPTASVNKERKIVVTARDVEGKTFLLGGEPVKALLHVMGSQGPPVTGNIVDKANGTYEVSLTPKACGEHELSITISCEPIKHSPFVINVRQQKNYTTPGPQVMSTISGYNIWDVAIDDSGNVYAAAYGNHCIQVFNKSGGSVNKIGSSGSGQCQFNYPSGIAIRGDVLYIVENNNNRVQKITTSGKFISTFGSSGTGHSQLSNPRGICLDLDGRIFVAEYSNNRISVFTPDGKFLYHITGNIRNPWGVAFDPSGNLHVANYGSQTISVFTPNATSAQYVTQYGSGVIQYPAGIAINEEGYCFIGEYYNSNGSYNYSRLLVLDASHKHVNTVQNFKYVCGVTLDKEGSVYVSDSNNSRVLKYW